MSRASEKATTKKETKKETKKALEAKVRAISQELSGHIIATGWMAQAAIPEWAQEAGHDLDLVLQAVRFLDRQKMATKKYGGTTGKENGWEIIVGAGHKRYEGQGMPYKAQMLLLSPSLGQISVDENHFKLLRDHEGTVLFTPAQFRAMLGKAFKFSGCSDLGLSDASIDRVRIQYDGCSLMTKEGAEVSRRPLVPDANKKKGVGVSWHEAVPAGHTIDWTLNFHTSHFTPIAIDALLAACCLVGFSPAGSGRAGGNQGIFRWAKLYQEQLPAIPVIEGAR